LGIFPEKQEKKVVPEGHCVAILMNMVVFADHCFAIPIKRASHKDHCFAILMDNAVFENHWFIANLLLSIMKMALDVIQMGLYDQYSKTRNKDLFEYCSDGHFQLKSST